MGVGVSGVGNFRGYLEDVVAHGQSEVGSVGTSHGTGAQSSDLGDSLRPRGRCLKSRTDPLLHRAGTSDRPKANPESTPYRHRMNPNLTPDRLQINADFGCARIRKQKGMRKGSLEVVDASIVPGRAE